jgi:regulator of telomere elongation helicase 1
VLRANRECRYVARVKDQILAEQASCDAPGGRPVGLFDIEDLVAEGRKQRFCPYYYERELAEAADIVFCPYTYIFDPGLAKQLPFDLRAAVVIMDEAHNLPSILSGATSANLTPVDTANAISECSRAISIVEQQIEGDQSELGSSAPSVDPAMHADLSALKIIACNLEKEIATAGSAGAPEVVKSGDFVFTILQSAGVTAHTVAAVTASIKAGTSLLVSAGASARGLSALGEFVDKVFAAVAQQPSEVAECYRFVLHPCKPEGPQARGPAGLSVAEGAYVLGFWCMDTAVSMRSILARVPQLLLTSGTLSPMDHFAAELGIEFRHVLQGAHVIAQQQLLAAVMHRGPTGEELDSSFAFRSAAQQTNLGQALLNLFRNSPDGAVVFFPSYATMTSTVAVWQTPSGGAAGGGGAAADQGGSSLWGNMGALKTLFVEPRDASELRLVVREFQNAVDTHAEGRGAALFAVARGKVSEGIDFKDKHGRLVVVTGIPFANTKELAVRLKRDFLTDVAARRPRVGGRLYTGEDWYRTEALRAVNQCIGRVIRHRADFGAVVLADRRFDRFREALSPWVQRSLVSDAHFGDMLSKVEEYARWFVSAAADLRRNVENVLPPSPRFCSRAPTPLAEPVPD